MKLSGLELPCPPVSDCQTLSLVTPPLDTGLLSPEHQSGFTALPCPALLAPIRGGAELIMAMMPEVSHSSQRTLRSCQPDNNWW